MEAFKINPTTGNQEARFEATLLSIADSTRQNSNGTNFKIVSIEFADVNGELQTSSAIAYEGNYNHGMEVGKKYLATATLSGDSVFINVSHLTYMMNTRATVDMFGFAISEAAEEVLNTRATSRSKQVITEDELADF